MAGSSSDPGFEAMLGGGHPNSLGRTEDVVALILGDRARLADLLACYDSEDEVVRLRTSNALKRVTRAHPEWVAPHLDHLLGPVAALEQPSAQWTLAQILLELTDRLSADQRRVAIDALKRNLETVDDWIVLIQTLTTLADWATSDPALAAWVRPHLVRLSKDRRKSVAGRAARLLKSAA